MAAQRGAIKYLTGYDREPSAAADSQWRGAEALLARLVAQAYLADHPQLMVGETGENEMSNPTAALIAVKT